MVQHQNKQKQTFIISKCKSKMKKLDTVNHKTFKFLKIAICFDIANLYFVLSQNKHVVIISYSHISWRRGSPFKSPLWDGGSTWGEREMFYLTTHSTHFIYGYMASDIWLRTILIVRKETCCRHIGYSY